MYKLIMVAVILLLASCRSQTSNREIKTGDSVITHSEHDPDKGKNEDEKQLRLNEGKKWKLDDVSRSNVATLGKILSENAGKDQKTQALAIREGTDKLIKECRMQGADHDALHLWLEGFLEHLRGLEYGKPGEAGKNVTILRQDLDSFYQYFE